MNTTETSEDYLKSIFIISKSDEVHAAELARTMGLTRPTVCKKLKNLRCDGFINVNAENAISLTENGEKIARAIYERNILFQYFLVNMGVDECTAYNDACRLEHAVSNESFNAFKKIYLEKHWNKPSELSFIDEKRADYD